jgi:nucleoid DNA-binding protein
VRFQTRSEPAVLVEEVARRTGLSRAQASRVVKAFFDTIEEALRRGSDVTFSGFGKFHVAERGARQGVHPRTGEPIEVAAFKVPRFTAGSALKHAVKAEAPRTSGGGRPPGSPPRPKPPRPSHPGRRLDEPIGSLPPRKPPPSSHPAPRPGKPPGSERHINAWVSGSGASGVRRAALRMGETYTLCINVGARVASGLLAGDTAIRASSIPRAGLDTHWTLTAKDVELAPHPDDRVDVGRTRASDRWTASFDLRVPPRRDSATCRLTISPQSAGTGRIDVVVMAKGEIYRQLAIDLAVAAPDATPTRRRAAAKVADEFVHAPAGHLGVKPPHEWQTPPRTLQLIIRDGDAHAIGWTGKVDVNQRTAWQGSAARVSGPIVNVRAAAETFRAACGDYLDDVPVDDLKRRLAEGSQWRYSWDWPTTAALPHHDRAWRTARRSRELRELANEGYALYEAFFPRGCELRRWIDSLPPGSKLEVTWLNTEPGWVPQVPWGLMYTRTRGAVDPMAFLGLRLRLAYISHAVQAGSRALGDPSQVNCGNIIYWGQDPADETATEARWQRDELAALKRQIFWPAAAGPKAKREVLKALSTPAPAPVGVLYLFCQSSFGQRQDDPVLGFDLPVSDVCAIRRTELGASALRDRPLVFANACTSAAKDPYMANDLQERFFNRGCRAFLGTETKVPIQLASRFARIFFYYFYRNADPKPIAAGEAVAQARQFLWRNYRNIGGLFYSYVNQYELFFAGDEEVRAMTLP